MRYVDKGTFAFSRPSCAVEATTSASKARLSQRKLSQARMVPIASPSAQSLWRSAAATAAAAKPKRRVSQLMRRSVWAPIAGPTGSTTLASIAAGGQAAKDFAHAGKETYRAEDEREPGLCAQATVEEVSHGGSDHNWANESERQLERERRTGGEIFRSLLCGRRRGSLVWLIVRRHIERVG